MNDSLTLAPEHTGATHPLPGGVGLTRLRVYDSQGPDGLHGGSPHMHLACTEAYFVTGGEGAVQTLSRDGFAEIPLAAGSLLWFTPGVVHRLVNAGELEIVIVMQVATLPEAGDCLLTFPDQVLADEGAYRAAAAHDPRGSVGAPDETAARLHRLGWVDVWTWLHDVRVESDDPREYLGTVALGSHLERLDADLRDPFVDAVIAELGEPVVDYVRLNILARRRS